jgi:hypothetical protein
MGDEVAILSGLGDHDQVVVAPSERLSEGLAVDAKLAPPKTATGAPTKAAGAPPAPAAEVEQARGAPLPPPVPATTPMPAVPATSAPVKK